LGEPRKHETNSSQVPALYRVLADWYPLLTPVGDYAEETAFYRRLFKAHCQRPPRTLLDLGSGGGHNAFHLKATLDCTLVDLEPAMLALSRRLTRSASTFRATCAQSDSGASLIAFCCTTRSAT